MTGDVPPEAYLLGVAITAIATIIVALISRAGKRLAIKDEPFTPNDHSGEHAHTRQVVLLRLETIERMLTRLHDRVDDIPGLIRQQSQIALSFEHEEELRFREKRWPSDEAPQQP